MVNDIGSEPGSFQYVCNSFYQCSELFARDAFDKAPFQLDILG
jgi:hypothetical protein